MFGPGGPGQVTRSWSVRYAQKQVDEISIWDMNLNFEFFIFSMITLLATVIH